MFIKIGGPCGAGKTTITKEIATIAQSRDLPFVRVKGGDILLSLAGVDSYEKLRKIPEATREALRDRMYKIMYEEDRNDPGTIRVRDAHFTLLDEGKFVILPMQEADRSQTHLMVVLSPDPEELLHRRFGDSDRPDRVRDLEFIRREIDFELQVARMHSEELGIPLYVINNNGPASETANFIIEETLKLQTSPEGQLMDLEGRPDIPSYDLPRR